MVRSWESPYARQSPCNWGKSTQTLFYISIKLYFPRSDWDLLEEISKNTGKCKTELIRQAVDEYLGE